MFVSSTVATPVALRPTDVWDSGTQMLSSNLTANSNSDPTNFSVMNFADPKGFNSIIFNWTVSPSTGATGNGQIHVIPLPPATYLFVAAAAVLARSGRRLGTAHR